MSIEFKIYGCKEIPEKLSYEVFCQYQWIDDEGRFFQTKKSTAEKNPIWNYRYIHDVYIVPDIMKKALTISVYGKYSAEDMQEIYNRFTLRPTTAALVNEGEMKRGMSPSGS